VLDRASKTLPFLYQIHFLKGKVPDGRRSTAHPSENPVSLQNFKERDLTDFGGAATMASIGNCFYRFLPLFTGYIIFISGSAWLR
jgi:hypothetical protein